MPSRPLDATPRRYDRFAQQLQSATQVPVTRRVGKLCDAPAEGIVLAHLTTDWSTATKTCEPDFARALAPRTVLLGVSAASVLDTLERWSLAGAVDGLRFAEWEAGSSDAPGPFGKRQLAGSIGAECVPGFDSGNYCLLHRAEAGDLVHILGDYLRVYADNAP
jgi:hypothetical protein